MLERHVMRKITDRLYGVVKKRYQKEQPERILTYAEINNIWYTINGKLYRGESESDVEKWCMTVTLK